MQAIDYQGRQLEEMGLDAILARKPTLALADEFAHTNVPGNRHPKRYQDVEKLLAAGIDVFTTLNIQHIESLNDVASFTKVRVRETWRSEHKQDLEYLRVAARGVRKKLEGNPLAPLMIRNEPAVGYRLVDSGR